MDLVYLSGSLYLFRRTQSSAMIACFRVALTVIKASIHFSFRQGNSGMLLLLQRMNNLSSSATEESFEDTKYQNSTLMQ